jgi:transcriptional regulator with XRE-family HTH domain
MATDPHIGTTIKRARERKRWTQRQLADALGVDRKTIDNWEHSRSYPRSSIGALEDVLGISLADGQDAPAELVPENEWERAVLSDPDLPPDVRRALVLDWRAARDEAWAEARRQASARKAGQAEAG